MEYHHSSRPRVGDSYTSYGRRAATPNLEMVTEVQLTHWSVAWCGTTLLTSCWAVVVSSHHRPLGPVAPKGAGASYLPEVLTGTGSRH